MGKTKQTANLVSNGFFTPDSDGIGIGTTNPTNAALQVEGRNFSFGGPGDNVSGEGNLYIGNYANPLLDPWERNIRIGSRNDIQIELYTDWDGTQYSDSVIFSSPYGCGWQYTGNKSGVSRSSIFPLNYSAGNAITDDYLFFQAGNKYLWFDADTGRLGINRSTGNGWSDTLDVNGTSRVTGNAIFDSNVGIATNSNLTANLTIGNIEETSVTYKAPLAIKASSSSDSSIGSAAIYVEEPDYGYGFYHTLDYYYNAYFYKILESGSGNTLFSITETGDIGIKCLNTDTFALKILAEDENVIKIENSNNGLWGSDIRVVQDSSSPAANDKLLTLDIRGRDSVGSETTYAKIISSIEDPTNGSEDGKLTIQTRTAGTLTDRIVIDSGGLTVNSNLSFPSGNGIDFSATSDATGMTSELLDDYEEGTWSPTISGTTGGSFTAGAANVGRYTKVGRMVTASATIHWTSASYSGLAYIGGLPFGSNSASNFRAAGLIPGQNSGFYTDPLTSFNTLKAGIDWGLTYVYVVQVDESISSG